MLLIVCQSFTVISKCWQIQNNTAGLFYNLSHNNQCIYLYLQFNGYKGTEEASNFGYPSMNSGFYCVAALVLLILGWLIIFLLSALEILFFGDDGGGVKCVKSLTVQQGLATFYGIFVGSKQREENRFRQYLKKKSLISVTTRALHRFPLTQPPRGVGPPTHVLVS